MSVSPSYSPISDIEVVNNVEQEPSRILERGLVDLNSSSPLFYSPGNYTTYFEALRNQQEINAVPTKQQDQSSKNRKKRKFDPCSSYVIRNGSENPRHVINITITDLSGDSAPVINYSANNSARVSVQYLVRDDYDDIMDETEYLISKIVKKISASN